MSPQSGWGSAPREFLDNGKTERECVTEIVRQAEEAGYRNLQACIEENTPLHAGDKVYAVCMKKSVVLFQIGSKPLTDGMNILGAHIDSPRMDVKQNPLYEDTAERSEEMYPFPGADGIFPPAGDCNDPYSGCIPVYDQDHASVEFQ